MHTLVRYKPLYSCSVPVYRGQRHRRHRDVSQEVHKESTEATGDQAEHKSP